LNIRARVGKLEE